MTPRTLRLASMLALGGLLVLAGGPIVPSAGAQPVRPAADSTESGALAKALERLAATAEVSLVYDAALVRGHDAPCAVDADAPVATLRCLLAGTGLDFVQTSGGTYVVRRDVRRPPQRGTIQGVVRDTATGAPVSQAHVRLAGSDGGAVTDESGRFQLSGLVAGPHTLVVSHLGYETARTTVSVSPAEASHPTVRLAPASVVADPVVVDAPVEQRPARREHASLPADQLMRPSPAGTPSVAHAAGSLLGVTTQAPYADLHIQGSASSAHEVRLDGVPVRNPATTGRLLGAFSPLALDGLTARTAGFGALRGNALSGLIELEHDLQRDGAQYATVRVDPVSVNGRGDGTVTLGETTATVMGAARIGVWNLHQSRALSQLIDTWSALDPVLTAAQIAADTSLAGGTFADRRAQPRSRFSDLHGAARLSLGPTRHLSVSAYHGRSTLGADLVTESAAIQQSADPTDAPKPTDGISIPASDRYAWTNTIAQARYESRLSDGTTGTLQAFLSRYRATSDYEVGLLRDAFPENGSRAFRAGAPLGSRSVNAVTEVGLDGTLGLPLSGRTHLTLSGGVRTLDTQVRLANAFAGPFRHADRTTRLTAAGRAEVALGPFTTLDAGLRLTGRPERGALHAEPRAALRYHRPHTAMGDVALRIGGGVYRRYTTQFELSRDGATAVVPTTQVWMPVPKGLTPPRTYHLATSAAWAPASTWSVGVEGYAKWQPHLLAVDYPTLRRGVVLHSPAQVLSSSRGRTIGGGVHVSYDGRLGTGTLRYAYTHARRTFPGRFGGRRVPPPWNEPHRLTLTGRVPLGGGVALTLRGTGVWGRTWGYRRAYYAYLQPDPLSENGPDLTRPADHTLPPLYRMNAGLVATHQWENVTVTGRIGLINLLNRANVADWGLRPTGNGTVTRRPRTLPGRRAVVSLKIHH